MAALPALLRPTTFFAALKGYAPLTTPFSPDTQQYLRKALFPVHEDLRYAGLLNPVDAPHHMRMEERSRFREGVVLRPKSRQKREMKDTLDHECSMVDVGLRNPIRIDRKLPPNIRVTVEIDAKKSRKTKIKGRVVRPTTPRTQCGIYWGYDVRLASSLSNVWAECPYGDGGATGGQGAGHSGGNTERKGYDLVIGTSENGTVPGVAADDSLKLKPFKHLLVVFGGLSGLESVVDADERLQVNKEDTASLFDLYLNTCPQQGSAPSEQKRPCSLPCRCSDLASRTTMWQDQCRHGRRASL